MKLDQLTLKNLKDLEGQIPGLAGFPSRLLAETYDEFVHVLYQDMDRIIYQIQENPELRQNEKEDRLTIDIQNQLRCFGYNASHDSKIGGHTDLSISKNNFLWIAEAKLYKSYNYLWEGFLQLTTRYSTGDSNQNSGGMLIYIQQENASLIMENWQKHLENKQLEGWSCEPCKIKTTSFLSTHKLEKSGQPFRIRHMPVMLHFDPQDKSGRTRKKNTKK